MESLSSGTTSKIAKFIFPIPAISLIDNS